MLQSDLTMPARGQVWRHHKGALYTIIGMSVDEIGNPEVTYTATGKFYGAEVPMIHSQPIGRFLQMLDSGGAKYPRFQIERHLIDNHCVLLHHPEMAKAITLDLIHRQIISDSAYTVAVRLVESHLIGKPEKAPS